MADRMIKDLQQLLIKRQATYGTAESSLTAADFAEVESPEASFEPGVKDIRLAGATSGNIASVIGRYLGSVKFNTPIRTGNAASAYGLLGRVLPSLGMAEYLSTSGAPFARLTIADKTTTWAVGQKVRNYTGAGDDWTGTIVAITTTSITVAFLTGDYAAVNLSDGVENTTVSDNTATNSKASVQDWAFYLTSDSQASYKDLTCWAYSGNKGTLKALVHKFGNVLGTGKLSVDFDSGVGMLNYEGKGYCEGQAAIATQPTVVPSGALVPAAKSCAFTLLGDTDYKPISLEIDFNNEIEVCIDPTTTTGCGISILKHQGAKWSCKAYKDITTVIDPETALLNSTLGILSLTYGSGANAITLASTKAQVTSVKSADQGGVEVFDMSGIFVDNDFSISLDTLA